LILNYFMGFLSFIPSCLASTLANQCASAGSGVVKLPCQQFANGRFPDAINPRHEYDHMATVVKKLRTTALE
jgi:hypothetical protein